MTTNPIYACSDSYIPWVVAAVLRIREAPAVARSMAVLGGLVALQLLAGGFQGAILGLGLGTAIMLATELHASRALHWTQLVRVTAATAAAVVVAALVAGAQLVPAMRFAAVSTPGGGMDMDMLLAFSMHPLRMLNIFISKPFGVPFTGPYFAAHLEQRDMPFPWAYSLYSGAASLALIAFAPLWATRSDPRRSCLGAVRSARALLADGVRRTHAAVWAGVTRGAAARSLPVSREVLLARIAAHGVALRSGRQCVARDARAFAQPVAGAPVPRPARHGRGRRHMLSRRGGARAARSTALRASRAAGRRDFRPAGVYEPGSGWSRWPRYGSAARACSSPCTRSILLRRVSRFTGPPT